MEQKAQFQYFTPCSGHCTEYRDKDKGIFLDINILKNADKHFGGVQRNCAFLNVISCIVNDVIQSRNCTKQFDIQYMALGLGGEVGEVQNEIKKLYRDNSGKMTEIRRKKIIIELGDVMWYLAGICKRLNCTLEDILEKNIQKLSK